MAAILDYRRGVFVLISFWVLITCVSCAKDKDTALVKDPNQKYESTIPWNKQEKWETQGDPGMANLIQGR